MKLFVVGVGVLPFRSGKNRLGLDPCHKGELGLGRHLPLFLLLALLLGSAVAVMAQAEHRTPFTGTWKLNIAKSRFNPGPPFKSFTLTFTPDGTRKLDLVYADGQSLKASLPWSDGKEVPVTAAQGMENVTATSKIRGNTFDDTWKQNGKIIEKARGVVSSDGGTVTVTVDGTESGRTFRHHLIFEKQ
jgi:hypothetical protein